MHAALDNTLFVLSFLAKAIWFSLLIYIGYRVVRFFALKAKQPRRPSKEFVSAFKRYRSRLLRQEEYTEIQEVDGLINELEAGQIPEGVKAYNIKKESDIVMKDGDDHSRFRFVTKFRVLGKWPNK